MQGRLVGVIASGCVFGLRWTGSMVGRRDCSTLCFPSDRSWIQDILSLESYQVIRYYPVFLVFQISRFNVCLCILQGACWSSALCSTCSSRVQLVVSNPTPTSELRRTRASSSTSASSSRALATSVKKKSTQRHPVRPGWMTTRLCWCDADHISSFSLGWISFQEVHVCICLILWSLFAFPNASVPFYSCSYFYNVFLVHY